MFTTVEFNYMAPINIKNLFDFLIFLINSDKIFFPKSKTEVEDIIIISLASYFEFQKTNSDREASDIFKYPPLVFYTNLEIYLDEYKETSKIPKRLEEFTEEIYKLVDDIDFNEMLQYFIFKILIEKKNITKDELNILSEINKSLRNEKDKNTDESININTEVI